jgi:hypothetical protein
LVDSELRQRENRVVRMLKNKNENFPIIMAFATKGKEFIDGGDV